MAGQHQISRASVRDAIRVLAATWRLPMATNHFPVADIVQTRIMLETWAAKEAAQKPRTAGQGQQLHALLLAMEKPGLDREEFHVLDAAFHMQLSSLAGNAVITSMMESLRSAIQGHVSAAIRSDASWQRIVLTLREQHGHILTAVLAHDGGAAAATPTEHIQWFHTNYNKS